MDLAQKRKASPALRSADAKVDTNEKFLPSVEMTTGVIPNEVRDLDFMLAPLRLGGRIFLRLSDFVALTKPEITFLVLLATAVGGIMASASFNPMNLFHALFGTALVASGAAALNQYLERTHDASMRRTANRPLPAGRLSAREALYFGTGLSAVGSLYLVVTTNTLTGAIGVAALLAYLFLYTPLKRRTHLCTLIGAFPGAAPVLMGWSSIQGNLAPQAWLLYATLFLWQFPHFLAVAWLYREDYAQARMLMVPEEDNKIAGTFGQMWIASVEIGRAHV